MLSGSTDALLCKKLFGTQEHSYTAVIKNCSSSQTTVTQLKLGKHRSKMLFWVQQSGCLKTIAVQIMLHEEAPLHPDLGVQ